MGASVPASQIETGWRFKAGAERGVCAVSGSGAGPAAVACVVVPLTEMLTLARIGGGG